MGWADNVSSMAPSTTYRPTKNEAEILRELYIAGQLNRRHLRQRTSLESHQVAYATETLVDKGYLFDRGVDETANNPGSPPKQYELTPEGNKLNENNYVDLALPDESSDDSGTTYSVIDIASDVQELKENFESAQEAVSDAEMSDADRGNITDELESLQANISTLDRKVENVRVHSLVAFWAAKEKHSDEQIEEWLNAARERNPRAGDVESSPPDDTAGDASPERDETAAEEDGEEGDSVLSSTQKFDKLESRR